MLRLFTFGSLTLETGDGSPVPRLRRPQLAMLAVLAAAGERGISRDRLASLFWPESDEEHARQSARQVVYALRQELGGDVVKSVGANIGIDSSRLSSDIADFREALETADRERAVRLARAPFLDGFYLAGASGFEHWMDEERGRITTAITSALLSLAVEHSRASRLDEAVGSWRELTTRDPLSGRFAAGLLRALADRGDRAEALGFAKQHELVMRRELDAEPDPEVTRLVAQLRTQPLTTPGAPLDRAVTNGSASPNGHTPASVQFDSAPVSPPLPSVKTRWRKPVAITGAAALLLLVVTAAFARQRGWIGGRDPTPTFAVGLVRDSGVPDSLRDAQVMTDMLATNLARVSGLRVLANSRLLELMPSDLDSSARYADAARRAGASELFEGQVYASAAGRLTLELRRVDLRSGLVRAVYRTSAGDRHALVDSVTLLVANELRLVSPAGSVADATTRSLVAYRFYEEGLRAHRAGDYATARRLMHAALAEDSTFAVAAWYEARFAGGGKTPDGRTELEARQRALRLAARAPDRERLTIVANLLTDNNDPGAVAAAESLTVKYSDDPEALLVLSRAYALSGAFQGAAAAAKRAITLDSIAAAGSASCRWCDAYNLLAEVYSTWDSIPAAMRATERFRAVQPQNRYGLDQLTLFALRLGDTAQAGRWHRERIATSGLDAVYKLRFDLMSEAYSSVEEDAAPLWRSSAVSDRSAAFWAYFIALRSQGRLREAMALARQSIVPGGQPSQVHQAIIALDQGDASVARRLYERLTVRPDLPPAMQSRERVWLAVRLGMAVAAEGDTARVRALVDTVEQWGRGSLYGRDQRLHHYLRGKLHAMSGRHDDAVREYRAAVHSPTLGFTRVNYEMARSLLRLDRPREAAATLQAALRGVMDASNLYISRTELHELLADAFAEAGQPDSAAVHYRRVDTAWRVADPMFQARREKATAWLARHAGVAGR